MCLEYVARLDGVDVAKYTDIGRGVYLTVRVRRESGVSSSGGGGQAGDDGTSTPFAVTYDTILCRIANPPR